MHKIFLEVTSHLPSQTPQTTVLNIERGETQKDVNYEVLRILLSLFPRDAPLQTLDLPCGSMQFIDYLQAIFYKSSNTGADINPPSRPAVSFHQMDLTKDFTIPEEPSFDLITSISGVMMFSNTLSFIKNCSARLKRGGTFMITNDNSATIMDRLAYMFLGRLRMFKTVYEDGELLTEHVPIQELCRLLRTHGITISDITYTSFYLKDLILLPLAIIIFPFQYLSIRRLRSKLPADLINKMHPFKQLFFKHYIITGKKA